MDLYKEIGAKLAEIRREKNLSQEKLAELSDSHEDYIGKVERGERKITIGKLNIIIKALNLNLSSFFEMVEKDYH